MPDTATPPLVEVDIPGAKISLPKDQAEALIKYRDGLKAESRTQAERLGAIEAQAKSAEEAVAKARRDAELAAAEKAGEVAKVREILTRESAERTGRLASRLADTQLRAALLAQNTLAKDALPDIMISAQRSYRVTEDGSLEFLDAAGQPAKDSEGKPVSADAWAKQFLESRPHFRTVVVPAGNSGRADASKSQRIMRRSEIDMSNPEHINGVANRSIRVVDE